MRHALAQEEPPQPTFEGDQAFSGLNMKMDRDKLPPGTYARGVNKRVSTGRVVKRNGTMEPAYCNATNYDTILGSFIYSNPNGDPLMLIATPTGVVRMTSGGSPSTIPLPAGVTLTERVYFTQAFNKVIMTRGFNAAPLQWDGSAVGEFEVITRANPGDTARALIPNHERGVVFQSRYIFPFDRTQVGVSDIGNYTEYDPILANFPANLGNSDVIMRLFKYPKAGLIIGKENRHELLRDFTDPVHPEAARLDPLNDEIGTCAWDSWAMVGGDVFFLSKPGGVFSIAEVIQDRLEASPVPVSDAIEPLIKRINWAYAGGAVSAVQGIYFNIAFPIDGATTNNCRAVYNTVTKQWEGYDTWDADGGMQIDNFLLFDYQGTPRLYAVNHGQRSIHLLDEGKFDDMGGVRYEIADSFESRGYATLGWNAAMKRDFRRLDLGLAWWWPSITITELTDRASDVRPLTSTSMTRNPAKYQTWGKRDYVLSNVNVDHAVAGREDYSFTLPPGENDPFYIDGVDTELKQEDVIPFSTRTRGRYVSVRVESTQGDCDISSLVMESVGLQRETRRAG